MKAKEDFAMEERRSKVINLEDSRSFQKFMRNGWLNKIITTGIIFLLVLGTALIAIPGIMAIGSSRTGNEGNEPDDGFSEGTDIFEIYHDDDVHNTTFAADETVNLRITTYRVNLAALGPQTVNRIIVSDYDGQPLINLVDDNAFTQQTPYMPPYIYEGSFPAPTTPDHYLVFVMLVDSPPQGKDEFITGDVIRVGSGAIPPKHIQTHRGTTPSTPTWIFGNADTVMVRVHTPGPINPANSDFTFADYQGNSFQTTLNNLQMSPIFDITGNTIIMFSLSDDLDLSQFPYNELKGNYWYTVSVDLVDADGTSMAVGWTAQIQILPPPVISSLECDPTSILAAGSETTTIYAEFTDEDTASTSEFYVTFEVRDPNDDIITLVDNQTNGNGGLTVTEIAEGHYNASYIWDPPDAAVLGDYDLYVRINDSKNGMDVDDFDNNLGELLLTKAGEVPVIEIGNTTCLPGKVNKINNEMAAIFVNFSDTNVPALNPDEFVVTFKVRDESNNEIILAENKVTGDTGDAAGTSTVVVDNYASNLYTAAISWDPDVTVPVGMYDLYFSVSTIYGLATDDYDNNNDELEIYSTGLPPQIITGSTSVLPSTVDVIGTATTMIFCEFIDTDNPAPDSFNVTFNVRPPSNQMNDVITLVNDKADGGAGEFGDTVSVQRSSDNNYIASYNWDPPETAEIGFYDLYFMVRDEFDNSAEDNYAPLNLDELEIITSVTPPSITPGDTKCVPTSVNKIGSGTTKIYCEFTDSNFTDINDFSVTFKVRDPNDSEIVLVDNKLHGEAGEDPNQVSKVEITYSGTVFTAWYDWDPPITIMPGDYDLYFGVRNKDGGFASDSFSNNPDELLIETTGNPPVINKLDCVPSTISTKGTDTTSIFAEFTDLDNPPVSNFTITLKVRDPNNNEKVLVNNKTHGGAAEFGGTIDIKISGSGYIARYYWDPSEDNQTGKYDLYCIIHDETYAESEQRFDQNLDKLELTSGAVEPGTPSLDVETPSRSDNTYNFTVTYTDPDNDPPNADGVILYIGTEKYTMIESDPSDENYTDGKKYYYSKELEDGNYTYSFKVTDTNDNTYTTDNYPLNVAPPKEESPEKESEDNTALIIAILVIVILLIIILLLFLMMKKKTQQRGMEPQFEEGKKPSEAGVRIDSRVPEPEEEPLEEPLEEPEEPETEPEEEKDTEEPTEEDKKPEAEEEKPKETSETASTDDTAKPES